ncbi:MAG: DUF2268 domain-containing putative Zn-dependent protease [Bacteroidota bacterium]
MKTNLLILLLLLGVMGCDSSDTPTGPNGQANGYSTRIQDVSFNTSDVDLFWDVFDHALVITEDVIRREYINEGSKGLKAYVEKKPTTARSLAANLVSTNYSAYYQDIRPNTVDLSDVEQESLVLFREFQELFPDMIFPDVYFLIGAMEAGGKISQEGVLVAVEMFSKNPTTSTAGLSNWHQQVTQERSYLTSIVIHETVHVQQFYINQDLGNNPSLLKQCMIEGGADFITALLLDGKFINEHIHAYADSLEEEIWEEFKLDMNNSSYGDWLYSGSPEANGRPADLGYYVGYKMVEHYYENATDKKAAIKEYLETSDFAAFLEKSGYEDKFD